MTYNNAFKDSRYKILLALGELEKLMTKSNLAADRDPLMTVTDDLARNPAGGPPDEMTTPSWSDRYSIHISHAIHAIVGSHESRGSLPVPIVGSIL